MTREDFVVQFRHEIEGWLLDAAVCQRTGGELSVFLRHMRQKIEVKLGVMYDSLQPKPSPAANGVPQPRNEVRK